MIEWYFALKIVIFILLASAVFTLVYQVLSLIPARRKRTIRSIFTYEKRLQLQKYLMYFFVPDKKNVKDEQFEQLLKETGFNISVMQYRLYKRIAVLSLLAINYGYYFFVYKSTGAEFYWNISYFMYAWTGFVILLSWMDKKILLMVRDYREGRVIEEILLMTKRLYYYLLGNYNLHSALNLIVADLDILKSPIRAMLNDWYEDSELAIKKFGEQVGTKSAQSFSASLLALRLSYNEDTLDLMNRRAKSYKNTSRSKRKSKKEGRSLMFYVVGVLPLLLILAWFMYPWFKESIAGLNL